MDWLWRQQDRELVSRRLDQRGTNLDGALAECSLFAAVFTEFNSTPRNARHIQKVVHQAYHLQKLAIHYRASLFYDGFASTRELHDPEGITNRSQRIPQLMGQCCQELILPPVGFA